MSCDLCPSGDCPVPFERVAVQRLAGPGTTVAWSAARGWRAPAGPVLATLEVSAGGPGGPWRPADPDADPADTPVLVDPARNRHGPDPHYRVRLSWPGGGGVSDPVPADGGLRRPAWLYARQVAARLALTLSKGGGSPGYLYKRRHAGEPCRVCLDPAVGAATRVSCPDCYGTGWRCGYFPPVGCVWLGLSTGPRGVRSDPAGAEPPADDRRAVGKCVLASRPAAGDVWAHAVTDERYEVIRVTPTLSSEGVPVLGDLTLAYLPPVSPLYRLPPPAHRPTGVGSGAYLVGTLFLGAG